MCWEGGGGEEEEVAGGGETALPLAQLSSWCEGELEGIQALES